MTTKKFSFMKWEGMNEIGEGETVPMSKKLKPNQFIVLSAIAMFQGVGGVCDTTQQQFSEHVPYSRESIGKTLESLLEFTYEGKPVIERFTTVGKNGREQYVHKLLPNKLFGVYGEEIQAPMTKNNAKVINEERPYSEETSQHVNSYSRKTSQHDNSYSRKTSQYNELYSRKTSHSKEESNTKEYNNIKKSEEDESMREMSPKEVITLFCEAVEKKHGSYKVVWGRDMKLAKAYLETVTDLKNNDKKRIIELIVENYEHWSSNPSKYPLKVATLKIKWVQDKARKLLKEEKEGVSQMEKQNVDASKRNDIAISSIMARLGKKKEEQSHE